METTIDLEAEKKEILKAYRHLLRNTKRYQAKGDLQLIRKAFDLALEAHKDMRRKSGEPYIYHPLAVAEIVTAEIGLGAKSIVCALLHDVVEDTHITLEDIRSMFGDKVATIIDGLTKISGVFDHTSATTSIQAENFRKMLLTLSSDVRVILIKLADRLHNMRTLDSMARDKQLKIASETLYLYAPLAHRLGLYAIKTEMEDLSLKYTEPEVYESISNKLIETQRQRQRFINKFSFPIMTSLTEAGLDFDIKGRTKSIYSIYKKMKKQEVPFEEVYDLFAIRIILNSTPENEKSDCWRTYSIVTDHYVPNTERMRDWISTPKSNGYESLHTTVMSSTGQWVEVQIRTKRMDDIAEKGLAAHWKYKESSGEYVLEEWISKIREVLENPDPNALDFIDDFKLNLFAEEIFVFTPKGELRTLPVGATSLDFAFEVHSEVGMKCIGAKINNKLMPLSYKLKSGDQIEVLTSSKQYPKEDWLNFVVTGKAKSKIKQALKDEKRQLAEEGKEILERKFRALKAKTDNNTINRLVKYYKVMSPLDLYYRIANKNIELHDLKEALEDPDKKGFFGYLKRFIPGSKEKDERPQQIENLVADLNGKPAQLLIGDNMEKLDYTLSKCCNPIPGDDVFGFITINEGIKIHRVSCPNAIQLMSKHAYRVIKAKWTSKESIAFLAGLKITGIDEVGIVNNITKIISNELHVNMRSISFEEHDGTFDGTIMVYVHDTQHLTSLVNNLKKVNGVHTVTRMDTN